MCSYEDTRLDVNFYWGHQFLTGTNKLKSSTVYSTEKLLSAGDLTAPNLLGAINSFYSEADLE